MEWILRISVDATEALQGRTETLKTAPDLIEVMKTLFTRTAPPRGDYAWDVLWEMVHSLVTELNLPERHERRVRRSRHHYGEMQDRRCHSKEDYCTEVFIPTCVKVIDELKAV